MNLVLDCPSVDQSYKVFKSGAFTFTFGVEKLYK